MDRLLYVAMNGAAQVLKSQAVNANNLANSSTNGFKADLAAFSSVEVKGPGHATRAYAVAGPTEADLSAGSMSTTGRDLDMAVQGEGWIAVQAADGSEGYTRAGDLRITANGLLTTGAGNVVLGSGGPIAVPPAEKLEIGEDGTITIRPVGQSAQTLAVVDRIRLVNPDPSNLVKGVDGLFRTRDNSPVAADASVRVVGGALESSNVSAVSSLVNMIELARQFEMQVKMMQIAEEIDSKSAEILRTT